MIYPVQPAAVLKLWPQAKRELDRAFEHAPYDTADQHLPALLRDQEQLWHIHGKAWAITRVVEGKAGRAIECVALAGAGLRGWRDEFMEQVEAWGKRQGCVRARIAGRIGWLRAAPKSYTPTHVTFEKEI